MQTRRLGQKLALTFEDLSGFDVERWHGVVRWEGGLVQWVGGRRGLDGASAGGGSSGWTGALLG